MARKKNKSHLGRALMKDRFGSVNTQKDVTFYNNIEKPPEKNEISESKIEESSIEQIIINKELRQKEYETANLNLNLLAVKETAIFASKTCIKDGESLLSIPRRPKWDNIISAETFKREEEELFLQWKRDLLSLQECQTLVLSPFEKNLNFWRQLWKVIENSDIVVQVVDARNPLIYRCLDLEKYVKEIDTNKMNLILINKADFLSEDQRKIWSDYFTKNSVKIAFFSALNVLQKAIEEVNKGNPSAEEKEKKEQVSESVYFESIANSSKLLNRDELIMLFKTIYKCKTRINGVTTVGFVGYPNVGKSSTVNALVMSKKVSVSATPGKTKHFQTLYIDENLLLCDCPGLVMPSLFSAKSEMILNGILSIDQAKDFISPFNLLSTFIPLKALEDLYGFTVPISYNSELKQPSCRQILDAHGYSRGFMTGNGQPDNSRSARTILKDFVAGKILFCVCPPDYDQEAFNSTTVYIKKTISIKPHEGLMKNEKFQKVFDTLDAEFFSTDLTPKSHTKGVQPGSSTIEESSTQNIEKPWKKINKHKNKNKKEKSRRIYASYDQH